MEGKKEVKPWVERFVKEYRELVDRYYKLQMMLDKWEAGTLDFEPKCPRILLEEQLDCMLKYKNILENRAVIEGIKL